MMGVNYARKKIRNYFFRKTTVFVLRLTLLKLSVINALLRAFAWNTRWLKQTLTEFGEPQLLESVKESDLKGEGVPRSIRELKPDYTGTMEYENEVLHECPVCDSNIWNIKASFEDYELAVYFVDMECASCGTYAKAPTLADKP
jgi:hypothetical protein